MLPIVDSRVSYKEGKFVAVCACKKTNTYATKDAALTMLERGNCRFCKRDYRNVDDTVSIYKNAEDKWCSICSGCGVEQAYTRKDHAKQSTVSDWQCRKCVASLRGYSSNQHVGDDRRLYNKFRKSANARGISWDLNLEQFISSFDSTCALTGWSISMKWGECTASLDRISSKDSYNADNIQWVHTMVNMCKNKYNQEKFIEMCEAVANKVKW